MTTVWLRDSWPFSWLRVFTLCALCLDPGETHDNDRESTYLCFVACLGRIWLHFCNKKSMDLGPLLGDAAMSLQMAWLLRPRGLGTALWDWENIPRWVCLLMVHLQDLALRCEGRIPKWNLFPFQGSRKGKNPVTTKKKSQVRKAQTTVSTWHAQGRSSRSVVGREFNVFRRVHEASTNTTKLKRQETTQNGTKSGQTEHALAQKVCNPNTTVEETFSHFSLPGRSAEPTHS